MPELYLSRLRLAARRPQTRRVLSDIGEMHRLVMAGFPDGAGPQPRASHSVLWRLEEVRPGADPTVLVQSATRPDWSRLPVLDPDGSPPETREIGELLAGIAPGTVLRFRLVANPSRKIDTKSGPDGARRNGRRVPLRGDDEALAWLVRKGADAGFTVGTGAATSAASVVVRRFGDGHGTRPAAGANAPGRPARVTMRAVAFEGVLTVADPARFADAVREGFGSGKAFGHGLLTIAPP